MHHQSIIEIYLGLMLILCTLKIGPIIQCQSGWRQLTIVDSHNCNRYRPRYGFLGFCLFGVDVGAAWDILGNQRNLSSGWSAPPPLPSHNHTWIYSHTSTHTYEYHGTAEPSLPDEDASHLSVDGAQVTKWVPRHTSHLVSPELIGSSESVKGTHMKLMSADEPPMDWCHGEAAAIWLRQTGFWSNQVAPDKATQISNRAKLISDKANQDFWQSKSGATKRYRLHHPGQAGQSGGSNVAAHKWPPCRKSIVDKYLSLCLNCVQIYILAQGELWIDIYPCSVWIVYK